ncbi:hypothetical protein mRhiFer1_004223 [Rhinolophus ferrumequinum]|uniref:Uncharacterized protein n=1 Tax=Rhinolophus ferrumequinum TaxID=59479 RepID=A0A7J7SIL9_RHIFE|nr:hypothetical protein mRhiFer1_004223 [Rhinolophus ferrumequinum]
MVEKIDGVVPAILPPNYTPSSQPLQTTLILGLIPESNLLSKLGFQSQESKFGFKIEDLDSMYRKKENVMSSYNTNKTRNEISETWEFKVQKLHQMAPMSLTTVLFL